MNITNALINLVSLFVVLCGRFLRAITYVAIAMGILWLIGYFFPYVSDQIGLPCQKVYACMQLLVEGAKNISAAMAIKIGAFLLSIPTNILLSACR